MEDGKIYVLKNYVMEQVELIDREIQQDQNTNTYRAAYAVNSYSQK